MDKYIVYDLEVYPNCFTGVFADPVERKMHVFEISDRKDDSKRLRAYLTKVYREKIVMVGYNCLSFDSPILHKWLANEITNSDEIYQYAQQIIDDMKAGDKFSHLIPAKKQWLRQLDLYKINHYDNKAKATSLKMIEFNMRSENIEDLPYEVGTILTSEQIDNLIEYNKHDVLETLKFFQSPMMQEAIEFRKELSAMYDMDFTNFNDGKIGKQFFQMRLEKEDPEACYRQLPNGKRVMRQTKRKSIDFGELNLSYIEFETPEFKALFDWFKKQVITETKGAFSDVEEHNLGELAKYCNLVEKKKKLKTKETTDRQLYREVRKRIRTEDLTEDEVIALEDSIYGTPDQSDIDKLLKIHPMGWVERSRLSTGKTSFEFKWRIAETINVVSHGFEFVYGTGGIHGSVSNKTYRSDDDWVILDFDYASMYPNIFISNRIYPEHLSELFCDVYQDLYIERKKHKKGTNLNLALKLALNNVYGSTNDQYSPFYDPKATINCTVLGQLTLSVLAERLMTRVPHLEMIQCNTDGLTVYVQRQYKDLVNQIVKDWDKVCGLEMEEVEYKMMAIADVNNYIAEYVKGGLKMNGRYEYRDAFFDPDQQGLAMHQNKSALIIKRAAVLKATEGKPIERTIRECKDPYDFMLRTKVPRSSSLVLRDEYGNDTPQQNICRYYIANNGGRMVKIMPPLEGAEWKREIGIDAAWLVKTCNNMKSFDWDINYDYYISEAVKLYEALGLE